MLQHDLRVESRRIHHPDGMIRKVWAWCICGDWAKETTPSAEVEDAFMDHLQYIQEQRRLRAEDLTQSPGYQPHHWPVT